MAGRRGSYYSPQSLTQQPLGSVKARLQPVLVQATDIMTLCQARPNAAFSCIEWNRSTLKSKCPKYPIACPMRTVYLSSATGFVRSPPVDANNRIEYTYCVASSDKLITIATMARFLHIADLHLGRTLHNVRLLPDQIAALAQIETYIRQSDRAVDAILLAGDIYDRAIPPTDAIAALNHFLNCIAGELGIQVIIIPGNHDSAERLGFAAALTKPTLHIAPPLGACIEPVSIRDETGIIEVFPLPFLDPTLVRSVTGNSDVRDQDSAMTEMIARIIERRTAPRSILVAHAFVRDGETSESERDLYVGGSSLVAANTFSDFDYVALGHLHKAQSVDGAGRIQYAGSLLKYSKSEAEHQKSFSVVDMDRDGEISVQRMPILPVHDLRVVQGDFASIDADAEEDPNRNDYIFFELTDRDPISEVMARLKAKYPNAVHLSYVERQREGPLSVATTQHHELSIEDHFSRFYESVTKEPLEDDQRTRLTDVIRELGTALEGPT
jgi:exonuclease SbcD